MNRRAFLTRAAVGTGVAGAAMAGSWRFMLHHIEVVDVPLPVVALPTALEGAHLVQLSDLHIGHDVDDAYVQHTLDIVGALAPDILAFTGDFVTWRGPDQLSQLDGVLHALPKATLATVAVLGNHDYGFQWRQGNVANEIVTLAGRHGIDVIRNDVRIIEGLRVLGVDDLWAGQTNVEATRRLAPDGVPSIALCHNPDVMDDPAWRGYRGWMLAGHTHGGQCRAPFCDPPILPLRNRRYAAGLVVTPDGRSVYVNRGVGHTLPIRINVRPEVTRFRLVRA